MSVSLTFTCCSVMDWCDAVDAGWTVNLLGCRLRQVIVAFVIGAS